MKRGNVTFIGVIALAFPTALLAAPAHGAAVAATLTVSGTQWGISSCFYGANEGQSDFNIADLQDAGLNAYRLWGTMERVEWEDDDGVYGTPSISQIKSDPDVVNWDWWDDAMVATPMPQFPVDLQTMVTDLKSSNIAPVWVLRNRSADGERPSWSPNPPTTQADWNEWWEYVFAVAYWLNVRNDFQVDHFEALNEPNHGSQGWGGSQAQYFELVEVTKDALDHVYDAYLPGRDYQLFAPVAAGGANPWVQAALVEIPDDFTTVDTHSYSENVTPAVQQIRQWMASTGNEDKELWLTEWGSLQAGAYDDPEVVVRRVITNMRRMSFPDDQHVDGSLIFKMYDQPGGLEGLISASGTRRLAYYGFRMAARALKDCRPTFEVTTSSGSLLGIATQDEEGSIYVLAINASGTTTFEADVDLSALVSSGSGLMWQVDATHQDEIVAIPSLSNGHVTVTLGTHAAVLLKFDSETETLFADDFEDGDAAGWAPLSGSWSVVTDGSKRYRQANQSGTHLSVAGDNSWTGYTFEATVKPLGSQGSVGISARYTNSNNRYSFAYNDDQGLLKIQKVVGGTWTTLTSKPYTLTVGTEYQFAATLVGSSLTFLVDDVPELSTTDATHTSGKIALATGNATASFDKILVTEE